MIAVKSWVETMRKRGILVGGGALRSAGAIAAAHPLARTATVEVRPYWDAPWDH
jgi:hypothetical protein